MEEAKGPVWRIDLTLPGRRSEIRTAPLHEQWAYILKAFKKWKRTYNGEICGGFRCIEVTRNEEHGWWHLHLHLLVEFLHSPTIEPTSDRGSSTGGWSSLAEKSGFGPRVMCRPAQIWEISPMALDVDDHYLTKCHYLAKVHTDRVSEASDRLAQFAEAEFLHTMKNKRLWDTFGDWRGSKQKHNLQAAMRKRDGLPVPYRLYEDEETIVDTDVSVCRHTQAYVEMCERVYLDESLDKIRNDDTIPDTARISLIAAFDGWSPVEIFCRYSTMDVQSVDNPLNINRNLF